MLSHYEIEKLTVEELQGVLKFFRRDIRHAESWLRELKQAEGVLKLKVMDDKREIVTALKKQILKRGLKQKTLAKKLGISEAAVSLQIKTGIRMAKVAKKYGEAMNCDPRLLIDF